ncbi:MAG: hypothetical protein A2Z96_00225 [Spirochaetes bacterium GWB1_48_6]|nr:MAG: hypothetical protein A2Z96_00225 [Spirochaetes bacterium GWB1_48_6]
MERIDPAHLYYHLPSSLKSEDKRTRKNEGTKGGFSHFLPSKKALEEAQQFGVDLQGEVVDEERLGELVDEIQKWGTELASNPSPNNIQEYRKKVSLFLRTLMKSSLQLEENEGRLRKDMKKPKYTLIRVVNEKLDQLATAILQNQKEKFDILSRTNELHGLLVDLLS